MARTRRSPSPDEPAPVVVAPVRPKRRVPGVYGRAQWWAQRVGAGRGRRHLQQGLAQQGAVLDADGLRAAVLTAGLRALRAAGVDASGPDGPLLLTAAGEKLDVAVRRGTGAVAQVGRAVDVPGLPGRAYLVLPLPVREADPGSGLDVSGSGLVRRDPDGGSVVVDAVAVTPSGDLLVAEVVEPGRYEAYALPTDPWLVGALRTVDAHWDWIAAEHRLGLGTELPDRICRLVLCAQRWRDADPDALRGAGVGVPGNWGGGGTVCERCTGAVGPIGRGDVLRRPPLLELHRWWWPWRRTCGWRPFGPYPAPGFGGIGRVTQLSLHPKDPEVLLAAAAGGGVWRTTDGGASWVPLMSDQPTLTMGAVAYAPSDPAVVYAASGEDGGGWNPAWPGVGVYRSVDGGATWTLTTPLPSDQFSALVVHPADPDTLYVAGEAGLHKSRDGGTTWITNPGLGSLLDGQVTDVVLAHDDPDRVYVGVNGDGVFRSLTGGEVTGVVPAFTRLDGPTQLPSGSAAGWTKLTIGQTGAHGSRFLAAKLGADGGRIFRTENGGGDWTELAAGVAGVAFDEWCSVIAVRPDDEGTLLAGGVGLSRTGTGGAAAADWAPVAGVHADQQDAAFSPANPRTGYLANDGGIYRTVDGGVTWEFRSGGLQITQFYDIDTVPGSTGVVAGGAQDNGVYYRTAGGAWRHIPWGDGTGVAVDPTDPRILYFSSQNGLPQWLRRSVDGGLTHQQVGQTGLSGGSPWVTLIKLDPTHPVADPATQRTLFVCGHDQLFRSTDGGQSWRRVEAPDGTPFTTLGTISALEYAPGDASVLYLGTTAGFVYRAGGGGATAADWTLLSPPGSPEEAMFPDVPIQSLTVDPDDPRHVWISFTGFGASFTNRWGVTNPLGVSHVYRSVDGGASWADASGASVGLSLPDVPTSAVAFHPAQRGTVYVGTDVGVFRTTTAGLTWTAFSASLPRSPVTDLSVGGSRLFAATMGRGVHVHDV
jgi:hypothetical protein